jgi:hypothetical protein
MGQTPKILYYYLAFNFYVCFSFDFLWHFLPVFFKKIWPISCSFWDNGGQKKPSQKLITLFYLTPILNGYFPFNSLEAIIFLICNRFWCNSCCVNVMRRPSHKSYNCYFKSEFRDFCLILQCASIFDLARMVYEENETQEDQIWPT